MKKYWVLTFVLFFAAILFAGCSNTSGEKNAKVTIDIGLDGKSISKTDAAIVTKDAAPSIHNIASIELVVTGADGMQKTFPIDVTSGTVTVELPAGAYTFAVNAHTDRSGTILSYGGETRASLNAGESKAVAINMVIAETKIVVPDTNNYRIVQIDNFDAPNWVAKINTDIGLADDTLSPQDIDFDSSGRIYILNNYSNPMIYRINNINSITYDIIVNGGSSGLMLSSIYSMAISRSNNYLYFTCYESTNGYSLYRKDLSGLDNGSAITLNRLVGVDLGYTEYLNSVAVDNDGYIYLLSSYMDNTETYIYLLYKYSIDAGGTATRVAYTQIVPTLGTSGYASASDLLCNQNNIYISYSYNYSSTQDGGIAAYSSELIKTGELLSENTTNMYAPNTFVAILNRRIYFTDGNQYGVSQLGSIDYINDTTVDTYGTQGTGEGQFNFYYMY